MNSTEEAVLTPSQRLGDAKAVGVRVGMSWRTVYRYADAGLMPWGVKIGTLRRWDLDEIERWISSGCRPVRTVGKGAAS
jgi:predicted DNA-binding transcriptional regulator AlpA